ncbi:endolytic transglycosylase MltG [Polynucleobacter sp. JS-Safj-400b-B2]|uniref:endolytic transglycosylase MltG n=1 Tax=Polynucleobacter sp. JS-Safj-400b-B2 TaxID=2576921 RepID=UPI001C0B7722|nr:endolytic transglycosylase MltG [Polynucleobacter sp. JS-Safj-400b-B2]MBU3626665.1 endolytic transglycosylase MltG [Polynucleobacter sp. JS-Safj-400b-B2]
MSRKIQSRSLFNKRKPSDRGLKYWLVLLFVLLGLLYGGIFLFPAVPNKSNVEDAAIYKVKILPQSSLSSIAHQLSEQGLSINSLVLHLSARSLFIGSKLKPGTYLLPTGGSLGKILLQIARGDRVRESIAIIPGMTIWQLRGLVDSHSALIHQTKGMSNKELLQSLNLSYPSDEGIFLPDTYLFDPDEPDINIYRRAAQGMQKQLSQIWDQKEGGLPLKTPYELLVLASIVEKETGRTSDRNLVAAVFVNRLDRGMPLQTDPTVIYGIGPKFDGNLRKADLRKDTPYNTYMYKGLPPSPIAMPSKESILAAAHPAKSNALFFVAKGDGSSHFSQTLKEHETAVDRYQRKIAPKNSAN